MHLLILSVICSCLAFSEGQAEEKSKAAWKNVVRRY
ncbi:hypothetical protein OSTOST_17075 [Ostertagia ostertagi]